MSKLTVTIPDDLHQKIREELERQGITTSQFIEQAIFTGTGMYRYLFRK